jgi:hypothetical protein
MESSHIAVNGGFIWFCTNNLPVDAPGAIIVMARFHDRFPNSDRWNPVAASARNCSFGEENAPGGEIGSRGREEDRELSERFG